MCPFREHHYSTASELGNLKLLFSSTTSAASFLVYEFQRVCLNIMQVYHVKNKHERVVGRSLEGKEGYGGQT